jgi:hypothetical protein
MSLRSGKVVSGLVQADNKKVSKTISNNTTGAGMFLIKAKLVQYFRTKYDKSFFFNQSYFASQKVTFHLLSRQVLFCLIQSRLAQPICCNNIFREDFLKLKKKSFEPGLFLTEATPSVLIGEAV